MGNLVDLINRAYYNNEEIIIERKGEPMVKISKYKGEKKTKEETLADLAGVWKDIDADEVIKYIYEGRRDGSRKKNFLAKWDS